MTRSIASRLASAFCLLAFGVALCRARAAGDGGSVWGEHPASMALGRSMEALEAMGLAIDTNALAAEAVLAAVRVVDPGAVIADTNAATGVGPDVVLETKTIGDGIAYARIGDLRPGAGAGAAGKLRDLVKAAPDGLIMDLRGSGGGGFDCVEELAGLFCGAGKEIFRLRCGSKEEARLSGGSGRTGITAVVLIDCETRSAAEVLSAVLKNAPGPVLLGTRTAGDLRIRETLELPGGIVVSACIRSVVLPPGGGKNGGGVEPDVAALPAGNDAVESSDAADSTAAAGQAGAADAWEDGLVEQAAAILTGVSAQKRGEREHR